MTTPWMRSLSFILTAALFAACDDGSTITETHDYNARTSGTWPAGAPRFIVVENSRGPVIIEGGSADSTVGWFLDAWATAASQNEGDRILAGIAMDLHQSADTLIVAVKYPGGATGTRALMSLTLPASVPCIIRGVNGSVSVSYLRTSLVAAGVGSTTLRAHEGSCDIACAAGNIAAEIALPDSGICRIAVGSGNIVLKVPGTTSATLAAATGRGSISCTGLALTNVSQSAQAFSAKAGSGHGTIQLATGSGEITITGF
jgi:hypothetical protein